MAKKIIKKYRFKQEYFDDQANSYEQGLEYDRNGLSTIYKGYAPEQNGNIRVGARHDAMKNTWYVQPQYLEEVKKPIIII